MHPRTAHRVTPALAAGFSLLEVMVTVGIVAILAGIAYPSYADYVRRSRIIEATTGLSDYRVKMEQFFQDNRSYADGGGNCGAAVPAATAYWQFVCNGATAAGYTINANGLGTIAPAQYRLVVNNAVGVTRSTATPLTGWNAPVPNNCWAIRKDGSCN